MARQGSGLTMALLTSPFKITSGGIAPDRKQADLKPLLQLEVSGIVFEDAKVPYLFFPRNELLAKFVPPHEEAKRFTSKLKPGLMRTEDAAYQPLNDLLEFIVNYNPEPKKRAGAASASARPRNRIRFRVYTLQISDRYDGAGRLKPDGLGGDRDDPKYDTKAAVPWRTVWIAIEVKNGWSEALQQACTYARSMLEVGNKWFAVVLVYNQKESALRFCFATRHGLFVTPSWNLQEAVGYALAASALVHVCYAPKTEAGIDEHRVLAEKGELYFDLPGFGTFKSDEEIFARMSLSGRSTHVYRVSPAVLPKSSSPPGARVKDPKNLGSKLLFEGETSTPFQWSGQLSHAPRPVTRSFALLLARQNAVAPSRSNVRPAGAIALPTLSEDHEFEDARGLSAVDTSALTKRLGDWVALCQRASSKWLAKDPISSFNELVIKDTWVPLDLLQIEIEVLTAMTGKYAFVSCVGYMTLPHRGMERLVYFGNRDNCPQTWQCSDWPRVYPDDEEPIFFCRVHRIVIYATLGVSLTSIGEDPWSIAQSIKDIIVALWILFKNGWLHRDIALGNMLPLQQLVKNSKPVIAQLVGEFDNDPRFTALVDGGLFVYQRSVLCDFDQAVKWKERRPLQPGRSGTAAFMAASRSTAWVLQQSWIDTLFDDLESVSWGHFYAVLRRVIEQLKIDLHDAKAEAEFSAVFAEMEARHYATFNGDDAYVLTAVKEWILKYGSGDKHIDAKVLEATWPLWRRMFRVANDARDVADGLKASLAKEGAEHFGTASETLRTKLHAACKDVVLRYLEAVNETVKIDFGKYAPDPATGKRPGAFAGRDDPENPAR